MLTRSQVAKRLGKSIATVRRMEGTVLHPRRDAAGVRRIDPVEVDRVAGHSTLAGGRARLGEIARSEWFDEATGVDADTEDDEHAEEREHRERLRRRDEESRAYDEQQRREREERALRQDELIRQQADAARLDALRARVVEQAADIAPLLRSSSPRELRRPSRDASFLAAMDELFDER